MVTSISKKKAKKLTGTLLNGDVFQVKEKDGDVEVVINIVCGNRIVDVDGVFGPLPHKEVYGVSRSALFRAGEKYTPEEISQKFKNVKNALVFDLLAKGKCFAGEGK